MERLTEILALAKDVGHAFVTTAGRGCKPHVAAARRLDAAPGDRLLVADWFCPSTMRNLDANPGVSIVLWDAKMDKGYQILGQVVEMQELSILNGYLAEEQERPAVVQSEWGLVVQVEKVLAFSHMPHTDEPL